MDGWIQIHRTFTPASNTKIPYVLLASRKLTNVADQRAHRRMMIGGKDIRTTQKWTNNEHEQRMSYPSLCSCLQHFQLWWRHSHTLRHFGCYRENVKMIHQLLSKPKFWGLPLDRFAALEAAWFWFFPVDHGCVVTSFKIEKNVKNSKERQLKMIERQRIPTNLVLNSPPHGSVSSSQSSAKTSDGSCFPELLTSKAPQMRGKLSAVALVAGRFGIPERPAAVMVSGFPSCIQKRRFFGDGPK